MEELYKTYDPKSFEKRIYDQWMSKKAFTPEIDGDKKPFTIVMPPPNVTGNLHLGHALNNTLQDIIIRQKRMQGYSALWVPGMDHASISTEAKVVEKIKADGTSKEELGRDGFLKEAWDWTYKYGGNIKNQLMQLGVSCDWSREAFTLDEHLSKAVEEVFIKYYEEGLLYRGDRIVNWCPNCGTAVSDAEVEHADEHGHLWYIRYLFKDAQDDQDGIVIATTRPETLLGDLAVAFDPTDERYRAFENRLLVLPLVGREIPMIADSYVDKEYGTGLVKITPSHDPNDFEVGARHNLGQCKVILEDATIAEGYGRYSGMSREEARTAVLEDLRAQGLFVKVEDLEHAVGHCERCDTIIEPLISKQWFVAMEKLAKPALEAYRSGELKLMPDRLGKVYENWLENIRDWCVSRQLWWGHRIPVYYCDETGEMHVGRTAPEDGKVWRQDPDTLDTWFSSALWPFSTLGWPEQTEDLDYFFPTDVLVTGYDIIFFWVIRMVFSSLHFTGKLPYHHVYFTGLIRDSQGRKMSKSLGNGVDPLEVIDQYGADALRFSLVSGTSAGNDSRYFDEKVESNRNFCNKLWNASRFVLMNLEEGRIYEMDPKTLEPEDKWILSRVNLVSKEVTELLDRYEIGLAAQNLYDFIWDEFCDWYIEFSKSRLYNDDQLRGDTVRATLLSVLEDILKLLHPFMPFITEEIYSYLPGKETMLIHADWPQYDSGLVFLEEEAAVEIIISAITGIRNARAEMKIAPSKKADLHVVSEQAHVRAHFEQLGYNIHALASTKDIFIHDQDVEMDALQVVRDQFKLYVPLEGLIDYAKELDRLLKEEANVLGEIKRAEKKLSNESFVSKAPEKVVEAERSKLQKYKALAPQIAASIADIKGKMQ